jgi:signal transduction histidine kinase
MERDGVSDTQRAHLLSMARSEAVILQRLVDDIRDAVTIEREYFAVALRPVQVSSLLAGAAASAEFMMDDHELVVGEAPHAWVLADAERIGQVLRNLLGNAVKYTPPGTRIELRARQEDGSVVIEVADQGPGIASDDLDRIFAKFVRGRDASGNQMPGAGLGLYLSRRIVLAHGADLRVASAPGAGTTFRFALKEVQS